MKLNQYSYESDKQEVTPVITKDEEDNNKLLETRISLYQLKKQLESNEGITETGLLRNIDEALKVAEGIATMHFTNNQKPSIIEEDIYGRQGTQIFDIMFNVEKDLVDYGASDKELEEKKQEIEKEYVLYSKIADIILSQEERKFWNALTTGREGGYDTEYHAKLGFNTAINSMIPAFLIPNKYLKVKNEESIQNGEGGMISGENFSAELGRAGSLEEVVKCFEKYNSMEKENLDSGDRSLIETQHIPNYTFVINSDMFGQTNQSLMNTGTISYSGKLKSVAMDQEGNSISYEYFEYNKDGDQYKIEDSQNDPTSNRRGRQDEDKKREEIAETLEKVKTNRDDRKNG